tara:strand:- start:632 stop:1213 length:582 start_codon:yes stop_codon:yes gene_type:complete
MELLQYIRIDILIPFKKTFLKAYNQSNFFKHTFCEFTQVEDFSFPEKTNYKSKSESSYFYTEEGVYRKSNHWGRVANCRWKLIAEENYKNQTTVIGFAKWANFFPLNSKEKLFFIEVNFDKKTAEIKSNNKTPKAYLFNFPEATKRKKEITHLFKETKWANYFELDIAELRCEIISEYIHSDKTLQQIKKEHS